MERRPRPLEVGMVKSSVKERIQPLKEDEGESEGKEGVKE